MNSQTVSLLANGLLETIYMTLVSTLIGYLIGLPVGILLTVTDKEGIKPNAVVYKILDFITSVIWSQVKNLVFLHSLLVCDLPTSTSHTDHLISLILGVLLKIEPLAPGDLLSVVLSLASGQGCPL